MTFFPGPIKAPKVKFVRANITSWGKLCETCCVKTVLAIPWTLKIPKTFKTNAAIVFRRHFENRAQYGALRDVCKQITQNRHSGQDFSIFKVCQRWNPFKPRKYMATISQKCQANQFRGRRSPTAGGPPGIDKKLPCKARKPPY